MLSDPVRRCAIILHLDPDEMQDELEIEAISAGIEAEKGSREPRLTDWQEYAAVLERRAIKAEERAKRMADGALIIGIAAVFAFIGVIGIAVYAGIIR